MFGFLKRLFRLAAGLLDWTTEFVLQQLTKRDFAQERAEAAQAEAAARDAAAREAVVEARETAVEARHVELMDALEKLTPKPARATSVEQTVKPRSLADRRREIADQSRSHAVIKSSTWTEQPEPDQPAVTLRVA